MATASNPPSNTIAFFFIKYAPLRRQVKDNKEGKKGQVLTKPPNYLTAKFSQVFLGLSSNPLILDFLIPFQV